MKLSVIIPTFNGEQRIENVIESLFVQTFSEFELIVVVDGSRDKTVEKLESSIKKGNKIVVVQQENKGRAGARNKGAEVATGDILIFIDDDMRASVDLLKGYSSFHQNYENAIIVGNQLEDELLMKTDFQKYKAGLSRRWMATLGEQLIKLNRPFITAANFSISKKLFNQLGGFDERLTDAEDYDLAIRVYEQSISIYFDPNLMAWHDDLISCSKYIKRQKEYKIAYKYILQLNPERNNGALFKKNSLLKAFSLAPFGFQLWIQFVDSDKFLKRVLPKKLRYKFYECVVAANS